MPSIRVLVVDDVVTVRRLLVDALSLDPDVRVVDTAANGRIALEKLPTARPDVVILDLEMPVMDGLETLRRLREHDPLLPVIVFSSLTLHGAEITLDALWLGANDYVTKPAATSLTNAILHVRAELLPRVKALHAARTAAGSSSEPAPIARLRRLASARAARRAPDAASRPVVEAPGPRPDVLAIGASTGGPRVLAEILGALPEGFDVPTLIVQHMPALFTHHLAERLSSRSPVRVVEARGGESVVPGCAYLAPGGFHLTLEKHGAHVHVQLDQGPEENACRPSVDPLLRSIARIYGPGALAVILTGMGRDGLDGCRAVRESHGHVLAQDEASSVVWGMPGHVVRAELAEGVLPPLELADEIARRAARGGRARRAA